MSRINQILDFLKSNPNDCFLKHALALEYVKAGDMVSAERFFRENKEYDPRYVATYYHLGKLLERSGRSDEALNLYKEGIHQAMAANDRHAAGELQMAAEDLEDQ